MDFSAFNIINVESIVLLARLAGSLFAGVLLCSLCISRCLYATPCNNETNETNDATDTTDTTDTTDKSANPANDIYVTTVSEDMFNDIVNSYAVCTCIIPSDEQIDDDANGVVMCDGNPDRGVIIFEVQDVYDNIDELVENDFLADKKYPPYSTDYYYLVYARIFTNRCYPDDNNITAYTKCDELLRSGTTSPSLSNSSEHIDTNNEPATAFYYINLSDTTQQGHKCGIELPTLSAESSPKSVQLH